MPTDSLRRVVLLGHHIGYSASPAMHNAAFEALALATRYGLREVAAAELAAAVEGLRGDGFLGANVTQPHKVAVCDLVDELAPEAARLGAANTLVRRDRRLAAHNTDLAAIREELAALMAQGPPRAVVLGAGGASRAVQAALADAGCRFVTVVHRADWAALPVALAAADLVVNATPIGTDADDSPVPATSLRRDLAVLDLVYRPSPTRLVREAREAGAAARSGAGVLLRQAAASFRLWTGRDAPIEPMRAALHAELGPDADA